MGSTEMLYSRVIYKNGLSASKACILGDCWSIPLPIFGQPRLWNSILQSLAVESGRSKHYASQLVWQIFFFFISVDDVKCVSSRNRITSIPIWLNASGGKMENFDQINLDLAQSDVSTRTQFWFWLKSKSTIPVHCELWANVCENCMATAPRPMGGAYSYGNIDAHCTSLGAIFVWEIALQIAFGFAAPSPSHQEPWRMQLISTSEMCVCVLENCILTIRFEMLAKAATITLPLNLLLLFMIGFAQWIWYVLLNGGHRALAYTHTLTACTPFNRSSAHRGRYRHSLMRPVDRRDIMWWSMQNDFSIDLLAPTMRVDLSFDVCCNSTPFNRPRNRVALVVSWSFIAVAKTFSWNLIEFAYIYRNGRSTTPPHVGAGNGRCTVSGHSCENGVSTKWQCYDLIKWFNYFIIAFRSQVYFAAGLAFHGTNKS